MILAGHRYPLGERFSGVAPYERKAPLEFCSTLIIKHKLFCLCPDCIFPIV